MDIKESTVSKPIQDVFVVVFSKNSYSINIEHFSRVFWILVDIYRQQDVYSQDSKTKIVFSFGKVYGGFQLLDLIITELKSHMTC